MPEGRSYSSGRAEILARKIEEEVLRAAGRGLDAARIFLTARVREAASVRALPRFAHRVKSGGRGFRSPTPATPGAPLRVVSGRFRDSITSYMESPTVAVLGANAKSPKGFNYPLYWEKRQPGSARAGTHPTFAPTIEKYRGDVERIVGQAVEVG